jgi:hypothetical protein
MAAQKQKCAYWMDYQHQPLGMPLLSTSQLLRPMSSNSGLNMGLTNNKIREEY